MQELCNDIILCTIYVCYYCLSLIGILLDKQHLEQCDLCSCFNCLHPLVINILLCFMNSDNTSSMLWYILCTIIIGDWLFLHCKLIFILQAFSVTITYHIDEMHDLIYDIFYFSLHVIQTRCKRYFNAILTCGVVTVCEACRGSDV